MAFVLGRDESLVAGVRRNLREQIESAIHHLATQEAEPTEAIHQCRKAIKRVRTLLRLLRRASGEERYAFESQSFATLAQKLGAQRDTQMLVEAVTRLFEQSAGSPFAEAVRPVQKALHQRSLASPLDEELLREVVAGLEAGRERLADWSAELRPKQARKSLLSGLRKMVRRGGGAYRLAYSAPSDEHFHAWRKRVKDLYYAACLLHLQRPTKLAPLVDLLDRTAEELGEERDLAILATTIHAAPQELGGAVPVALLLQLIGRRRSELRQALWAAGAELYQRSPAAMARRLGKRLET